MTDTLSREQAEQALLADPFDHALRLVYARLLLDGGDAAAALRQAELVERQAPDDAAAAVLQARCLHALQRTPEALQAYHAARKRFGFQPDAALEALSQQALPSTGGGSGSPKLQLVGSGAGPAVVRAIQQVPEEKVRFSSIAGMQDLKKTIRLKIIEPFLHPGLFARFRSKAGGGILLYGPPGCGKTMMARAVANECKAEFISVGISDVLNMWLGESERALAQLFGKARSQAPCVLFFDELDALAYSRAKSSTNTTRTVVNEFLNQLDGLGHDNRDVLVLAATNMPWDVDSAMKRPGRFARQIFVPPPDAEARAEMLQHKLTGVPQQGLDFAGLAARTRHYSGADIDGLIELATEHCLADCLAAGQERPLQAQDFEQALQALQPSTLDWLRSVRNVVKYAGDDGTYAEVERYLKAEKLL
jgi:SpoVK/Ycf46/Vps4 family AAA+-type ATPase